MQKRERVYLIDGNSFVYRAFHAIRGLTNSKGFPTNAIYGFTNMLLKLIKEMKPNALAVAFDSPVPTDRHRLYEEYKAQRPETPDELIVQVPYIREILKALNIKIYEVEGFEADDILAVLAQKAADRGYEAYIVTGDKDMFQIVNESIYIYDPMKNKIYRPEDVVKKFGLPPERIPELMALTGDTIDNIPGVKGIGEKTASSLLKEHSLEELINDPSKAGKKRLSELIKKSITDIKLSLELARIRTEVPLEFDIEEMKIREPDWQRLFEIFRELEFSTLMAMIPAETVKVEFRVLNGKRDIEKEFDDVKDRLFLFTITEEVNHQSTIVGVAFKKDEGEICYVPTGHRYLGVPDQTAPETLCTVMKKWLENDKVKKVGYDIKKLMKDLAEYGVSLSGELEDVMIASYLINPNRPNHRLSELILEYLYKKTDLEKELFSPDIATREIEYVGEKAAEAVSLIEQLSKELFKKLHQESLAKVYKEIEMPLIPVLCEMERTGIKVDKEVLSKISQSLDDELMGIKKRIYSIAGEEFNINSPKQLSRILFEKLGLKPIKRTKTGYSTDVRVLEELARVHELPKEILNWRTLSKLKSTYVDALPRLINPRTGRVHTTFNQAVTSTGRLSSSDPNLQNIPVRGSWGKLIRSAFVSEQGYLLMAADYSQIELRVLAHLSRDERLVRAFRQNMDIHTATASELFDVSPEQVTPDMRRIAKTVNFGVIYGISAYGLSEAIEVSMEDAQSYIDEYFLKHQGVKEYYERTIQEAKRLGYVKTMFGRKRAVPELQSPNAQVRAFGQRLAMNTPVQGTAADIIKIAMIRIFNRLKKDGYQSRMILQVHDELVFEVKEEELEELKALVKMEMEGVVELEVPLKVDIGVADNWADAH